MIKRADLFQKERDAYAKRQEESERKYKEGNATSSLNLEEELESSTSSQRELPRAEVIRRLRSRGQPILLFGEAEAEAMKRLRKLEIEMPELKEGWRNEFQAALDQVRGHWW